MAKRLDPSIRHVACIGLMGAGKTVVGRLVATELGWPFVDVDDEVEARTGTSVAALYAAGGEDAYRPLERQIVLETLAASGPTVLAAPGGVAVDDAARAAIAALDVAAVYLRADPSTLAERVERDTDHPRPLLGEDPEAALRQMFLERDAIYRSLADIEVQVDAREPGEVAELVLDAFTGGSSPPSLP